MINIVFSLAGTQSCKVVDETCHELCHHIHKYLLFANAFRTQKTNKNNKFDI